MGVLRVILALLVVIDHSSGKLSMFHLPGGVFAVKVFFIISGFYMAMILNKKYIGPGSYSLFISNRFLRIFPIYWVVIGLTVGLSFISFFTFNDWMRLTPYVAYNEFMDFRTLAFLGVTNIFLFGQDIVMFLGLNLETGSLFFTNNFVLTNPQLDNFLFIPQAWTIGLELLFYLLAPFVVRKRIRVIMLLIACSIIIRGFIYFNLGLQHDPWTYRFFPTEFALFLLGALSFRLYNYIDNNPGKIIYNKLIMVIYFFILIFYNYLPNFESGIDVKSILFYILTGLSIPSIFLITKTSSIDNRIGDLSYPIYIIHMLVIYISWVLIYEFNLHIQKGIKGLIIVTITLIASYILVKYVSDPIEKLRQRRVKSA